MLTDERCTKARFPHRAPGVPVEFRRRPLGPLNFWNTMPMSTTAECPLSKRISSAIEKHPHLTRRKLQFEAREGRVTLRGTVSSYYQKQMAQEALRRVDGVHEIENQLEVTWI
jgi:hypothetical protein